MIVLEKESFVGQSVLRDFTSARLVACDLSFASMGSRFTHAVLERCRCIETDFMSARLLDAKVIGGDWTRVNLSGAYLGGARFDDVDLGSANASTSYWEGVRSTNVRFDGASFESAKLDGSHFDGCSFRGATFASSSIADNRSTANTVFTDCDCTDTDWTERILDGARFVRCKLAGARGRPASVNGLVLEDCDVDADTFLARLGWTHAKAGVRMRYRIAASVACMDLRLDARIETTIESMTPPTESEARRALEPEAEGTVNAAGGEVYSYQVMDIVITPEPL
jgi:uncharacterized protein YjbI with pentapeptide repeats